MIGGVKFYAHVGHFRRKARLMLIRKFFGWEEASFEDYKKCYLEYGGNFSTHPDVLSFIHSNAICKEKYFVHHSSGAMNGAVCLWGGNTLANDTCTEPFQSHLGIPVAKDELILPIDNEKKLILPFKSKIISSINKNIVNRNELFNARRAICLAKPSKFYSKKTVQTRNRELKKFLDDGGEIKDQSEFSPDDMHYIYRMLYEMRRGKQHNDIRHELDFTRNFRNNFFGKILFINNDPCAFMMITKCISKDTVSLDFINIGINKKIKRHSLGSILMWININEVYKEPTFQGKRIRFSFGKPSSDYKQRWCFKERLGRLL